MLVYNLDKKNNVHILASFKCEDGHLRLKNEIRTVICFIFIKIAAKLTRIFGNSLLRFVNFVIKS